MKLHMTFIHDSGNLRLVRGALSFLLISPCLLAARPAQQPSGDLLQAMTASSRAQQSLTADIVLTWRTHGVEHRSNGTVRLMKPNYALITLAGDYPQRLLISDGKSRFTVAGEPTYTVTSVDPTGGKIESPWWGIPFRFFFTQSLNPFAANPGTKEEIENLERQTAADGTVFLVLSARGDSVMGTYFAKYFFNEKSHVLQKSSIQFGQGEGAALFDAVLSNIRVNVPLSAKDFRFTPKPSQHVASLADSLLQLGNVAPGFTLHSSNNGQVRLSAQMRGKKATLINFWFYNCAPCRLEFPEFEKLYEQFRSQRFNVIAIDKGDSATTVAGYVQRTGLTFPVVLGGDLGKGSVFDKYRVTDQFPATYLLDSHGRIVYRTAGEDIAGLKRALASLGIQ
jgi:peroxiredoxin/outer membrane lipoprotein-sorting protein